jgi:hypothetical protein
MICQEEESKREIGELQQMVMGLKIEKSKLVEHLNQAQTDIELLNEDLANAKKQVRRLTMSHSGILMTALPMLVLL